MPKGWTTRKLEVYRLHARTRQGPVDYAEFFRSVGAMDVQARSLEEEDRLVAVQTIELEDNTVWLTAYQGNRGEHPLIFNLETASERVERLASAEVVATRTHAAVDLARREAVIEYNHRGAKASDVAAVLQAAGRKALGPRFDLELNPVVDAGFMAEVDRFQDIRLARVRFARPNQDWNDWYDELTGLAEESEARTIEVEVTAHTRGTVDHHRGVMGLIRNAIASETGMIRNARVEGVRYGEQSRTTISLSRFVEHQRVSVRLDSDGHVANEGIRTLIRRYIIERRQKG